MESSFNFGTLQDYSLLLEEVLPHLKNTYKSIDLRIACVLYEGKWHNLFTLIRFTNDDVSLLDKQLTKKPQLSQLGKGVNFRIFFRHFSLTEFEELTTDLVKGSIKADDTTIQYEPSDIKKFSVHLSRRSTASGNSPAFFTTSQTKSNIPDKWDNFYDSVKSDVIPLGCEDAFEAIKHFFDYSDYERSSNYDLAIAAPVYGKVEEMKLEIRKAKITVRYHKNLNDLYLHYKRYNQLQSSDTQQVCVFAQNKGITKSEGDFNIWQIEADDLDLSGQSYENFACEAELFSKPLKSLISDLSRQVTELIAEKKMLETNPLAKIFAKFCPLDQFTKMLVNPTNVGISNFKLSETDNFERGIQWLFSLHGFQGIWLGKDYEKITDARKRTDESVDLLCYSEKEKAFALVNCKTSVPDEKHIDLAKNLANKISQDVKDLGIRVVPIIVSSKPCQTIKNVGLKVGVDIIDVDDIQRIVSKIYEGPPTPRLLLRTIRTSSTIGA